MSNPKRGEVWLVQLDPTRGQEIQKTRPAVVISSDLFSPIPMRIIIPITGLIMRLNKTRDAIASLTSA